MYYWNGIKINIEGKTTEFISTIKKYFHASHVSISGVKSDVTFSIYNAQENMLPVINENAKLIKARTILVENELNLKIYKHNEELWYLYHDTAGIWINYKSSKVILSLSDKLFSFPYYNVLLFFLYPLGMILENLGYFRVHASCVDIRGRTVLFTGQSGSGKSTAAFAAAANGGNIISDDITFLKKTGDSYRAHTITNLVKLHNDTINNFFPKLLSYRFLKNNEGEMYFEAKDINNEEPGNSILNAIITLEKTNKKKSSFRKIHPSKVVPHLFPSFIPINNNKFTRRKFILLSNLLNDIQCYNACFGTDMSDFYKKITNSLDKETF